MARREEAFVFRGILLLFLACPTILSAQMVRGTVTDAGSGAPIKAANLNLYTSDDRRVVRAVSDEDGKFEIVVPKGKTVYLEASRIGYQTSRSESITASTSELVELNVRLSAQAVPLQGIVVAARRQVDPRLQPFLDRASLYKRAGLGHIYTRKELERRPLALVSHMLRWVPDRPSINCSGMSLFIDDMPVDAEDMDLLVAPEDLEGAEIYNDLEVPPDLLYHTQSVNKPPDSSGEGGVTETASVLPPCRTVMLWRKPYAELNAVYASHPTKTWRTLLGAAIVGALLLGEQLMLGSR